MRKRESVFALRQGPAPIEAAQVSTVGDEARGDNLHSGALLQMLETLRDKLATGRLATHMGHELQLAIERILASICDPSVQECGHLGEEPVSGPLRATFEVHVLGRFRLLKAGTPIGSSRNVQPKPVELLQALIAFGGSEVGAGKVIDALWPDADGDAGYHALETTLYRLRRLLDVPEAVQMVNNRLTLDRRQFWVDVWELEGILQRLERPGGDFTACLAEARRLYEGPLLEHDTDNSWAIDARDALRARLLRRYRQLIRLHENERRWGEAAELYRTALEIDETAEDLHRGLMICQRELGQHSEVLRTYSRCRDLLMRSLGVLPDAKTQAIYGGVKQKAVARAGQIRSAPHGALLAGSA